MTISNSQHISQQFEAELQDIRSRVLAMGGLVEQQVSDALQALMTADIELAREVISQDQQVNEMEMMIDEECTHIIALRQPAAGDLRLVTAIFKTITDLERIGDEANSIAERALSLAEQDRPKKNYRELLTLGNHVRGILRDALDAFARMDVSAALKIAREDHDIDSEYESILRQLITYMMEDPRSITRSLDLMWSARSLERIGDHSHNLCEYVIYHVEGKDVRHLSAEGMEEALSK